MDKLVEDLDDSDLFCKTLIPKRKAFENANSKQPKQLKLTFYQSLSKTAQSDVGKKIDDDSSEEKIISSKSCDKDSQWNDSRSNYFLSKKSTNTCPLCLKIFKTDSAYSAHMKQCAKMHKMTTQQLLEALELQKKQMQERRDLGLCSQIIPSTKKVLKKKINNKESYDLSLGLALSMSLATCETKGGFSQELQKTTLEEFGFKSSAVGINRKKNDSEKNFALKNRTAEERQKIIVEKVAVLLLDEDQEKEFEHGKLNKNLVFQNIQVPKLWSLAENDDVRDWYVSRIRTLLLEEETTEIDAKSDFIFSDCIKDEISKLKLPLNEIYKNWNKMINNSFKSDLVGKTKDSKDVYLHSLVLIARCPEMLKKDCQSIFQRYNLETVLIYLEYLYCGTLNSLIRSEVNNLYHLAVDFNFNELINVLNTLKNNLLEGYCEENRNSTMVLKNIENNTNNITVIENKKPETVEEMDLFIEDMMDLTQSSTESNKVHGSSFENESNAEKSYWSFIQHEKKREAESEKKKEREAMLTCSKYDEEKKGFLSGNSTKGEELQKRISEDSETEDLIEIFQLKSQEMNNSDCITLSSGSESKSVTDFAISQRDPSKTPSLIGFDCEAPYFDPYENFHCFAEEQFSPVGLNSQSLLDISAESLKLSNPIQEDKRVSSDLFQDESKRTVGYCSTPVTARRVSKMKSSIKNSLIRNNKRKRSNLSGSRILRKSLGLERKMKKPKSSSFKRNDQRRNHQEFAEAFTNSVLNELSKSLYNSSSSKSKKFVEVTPTTGREEFGESVTPYPNYSNMGESLLKEQLTKYGLKKNLSKSKARKILRYIYEELHPFYNTETGQVVKMLPKDTPKGGKKSKTKKTSSKSESKSKNNVFEKKKAKDHLNSSKECEIMSDETVHNSDENSDYVSEESQFDDFNETLTQSVPSNVVDLPSAFFEFIENNSEYYQKILLYEPIWLEELQKNLKDIFKKHFKKSDLMDFLDQKCITFRSIAQAKNLRRRNEKKKENFRKKKKSFNSV